MFEINKIYNVDCYKAIKEILDKSIDCIYTDIPYIIQSGGASESALSQRVKRLRDEDLKDIKDGIDYSIFEEFDRVMKKINLFIWCSKEQIVDILNYWTKKRDRINFEILVWEKVNPTPLTHNTWLPNIEYCLYFREQGVKLNDGYEIKSKFFRSPINKKDKDLFEHPTIKPLKCVQNHLLHATQEGDIVLDPFSGSGTTCIAAMNTKRKFIGFEINENYYKISQDRLNGITVDDRKKINNGQIKLF